MKDQSAVRAFGTGARRGRAGHHRKARRHPPVIAAMVSGGHVLFEDYPGLGKTLLARTLAQSTQLTFTRIQFTPDLLPGDITGGSVYNRETGSFELRRGPIFTNILLADEVNRASPKTQSALLEAMQEGQVTIDGEYDPARPTRSSCSPRRTRSSTRGPFRCRRRSSTAS